jgi:single-strand DNA-binding protein
MAEEVEQLTSDLDAAAQSTVLPTESEPLSNGGLAGSSPDTRSLGSCHRNEVTLVGRLLGPVRERALRGGAVVCSFRVVVRRDSASRGASIDTLDCVAWGESAVQRALRRWSIGDLVEVRGALRRRFWRGVSGMASRCEIEVDVARRLARVEASVAGACRCSDTIARASVSVGVLASAVPVPLDGRSSDGGTPLPRMTASGTDPQRSAELAPSG